MREAIRDTLEAFWIRLQTIQSVDGVTKFNKDIIKNQFEVFGYDFMIDTSLNSWLIEINSSPSMAIDNQPTLHRMVSSVQRDLVKVVIDYYGQQDEKSKPCYQTQADS